DRLLDAALELHRVGASHDHLDAFAVDRLREHRGGRRAVTGRVRRLARDFTDHLRAHVLERVLEVDLLGHRHTVLGDGGGAELLVDDDVPALGAERDFDRVGECVHAAEDRLARLLTVHNLLCHDFSSAYFSITPRTSSSRMMRYSLPSILISCPAYLPNSTVSFAFTSSGVILPSFSMRPLPTAMTLPCMGFSFAVSGMMIPPTFCSPSSIRLTMMRSCSGLTFMTVLSTPTRPP